MTIFRYISIYKYKNYIKNYIKMKVFEQDYKIAINNILKDVYGNTDYWGVGKAGNQGIIKPITKNDDLSWSNYNFINTHWTVRDKVIFPYIKKINPTLVDDLDFNSSYTLNLNNREFFRTLWRERENIFGPNSSLKDEIVSEINKTRKSGDVRENFTKMTLESIPGFEVEKIAEAGGSADFMGIDLVINSTNNLLLKKKSTAQVKPFNNLTINKNNCYITTKLIRKYKTDLMVFTKQSGNEIHVAVFQNDPKRIIIEDNRVIFPRDLIKILINYNYMNKKSNYKTY